MISMAHELKPMQYGLEGNYHQVVLLHIPINLLICLSHPLFPKDMSETNSVCTFKISLLNISIIFLVKYENHKIQNYESSRVLKILIV